MKYFAILKDSLREASDSKVLIVMFGLSTLAFVFVASFSFTPLTAEATFRQFFDGKIALALSANNPEKTLKQVFGDRQPNIGLKEVAQTKGETDSPLGEYVLIVVHFGEDKPQLIPGNKFGGINKKRVADSKEFQEKLKEVLKKAKEHAQKPISKEEEDALDKSIKEMLEKAKERPLTPDEEFALELWKHVRDNFKEPAGMPPPRPLTREEVAELDRKAAEDVRGLFRESEELNLITVRNVEVVPRLTAPVAGQLTTQLKLTVQGTPRTFRMWKNDMSFVFGAFTPSNWANPLGLQIFLLSGYVIGIGSWTAVLLGVVITSFFIPNMLRKGTVDLLLAKPIQRWVLLLYKYIGGLTFIFLSTAYAIGGIWFVLALRSGVWAYQPLLLIFSITFFFAILYAVSTFVAVMTRSVITCILLTIAAWFLFFLIGMANDGFKVARVMESLEKVDEDKRWGDGQLAHAVKIVHDVMPRTSDLNRLNSLIVHCGYVTGDLSDLKSFNDEDTVWWESLLVCGAWIVFFLGVSCLWFSIKDY